MEKNPSRDIFAFPAPHEVPEGLVWDELVVRNQCLTMKTAMSECGGVTFLRLQYFLHPSSGDPTFTIMLRSEIEGIGEKTQKSQNESEIYELWGAHETFRDTFVTQKIIEIAVHDRKQSE